MNVFVITKTHFTGADQYTSVFGVYANKEVAEMYAERMSRDSMSSHYHVTTHNLQGWYD